MADKLVTIPRERVGRTIGSLDETGVKARPEIGKGLFTLHVARNGRKGRHFVLFRADAAPVRRQIDLLSVLHGSMDFACHLPKEE